MTEINVLDHGFVKLMDSYSSDAKIARYANLCVGGWDGSKEDTEEDVRRRIDSLMRRGHMTPFEFGGATFYVRLPIEMARQWMRHRTFSYLERSGRYCRPIGSFYNQLPEQLEFKDVAEGAFKVYEELADKAPREKARGVLPLASYTEFVFTADLRNLFHFLGLRLAPGAQNETRQYAEAIFKLLKEQFPECCAAFERNCLGSVSLNKVEQKLLRSVLIDAELSLDAVQQIIKDAVSDGTATPESAELAVSKIYKLGARKESV